MARAFYLVTEKGKDFSEYMIGSSEAKPLREYILELTKVLRAEATPVFGNIPFTGTNLPLSVFNTENIKSDTGFEIEVPFSEGVKNTMEWLQESENMV